MTIEAFNISIDILDHLTELNHWEHAFVEFLKSNSNSADLSCKQLRHIRKAFHLMLFVLRCHGGFVYNKTK